MYVHGFSLIGYTPINSSSGISMNLNSVISDNEGLTDISKFFTPQKKSRKEHD